MHSPNIAIAARKLRANHLGGSAGSRYGYKKFLVGTARIPDRLLKLFFLSWYFEENLGWQTATYGFATRL